MAGAPDHVVVGSGINGLVAAAMLGKAGRRVLVLERADRPGGCLRSDALTLPGFVHDTLAATFVLFTTGPAFAALGPDLARHGLELCNGPHPTGVLTPDGRARVLSTDRAANLAAMGADAPAFAAAVDGVAADAAVLFPLLGGPLWTRGTAALLGRQAWRRGPRGLAAWMGSALAPARGWLESAFGDELTRALLAPWVLHCGLTPESTYSAEMAKVVAFALEAAGAPVAKGGAGRAAEAFAALIAAQGGEVRTGAEVDLITTQRGRVTGVALASGERIACASVLASVTPNALYDRLLRDADLPRQRAQAAAYRYGRGDFQVNFALGAQPEWIAPGLEDVALLHLTAGVDAVSRSASEAERGLLPAVPTICAGQPHRLDPSRCPPGKAVLWCQIPDAPRAIQGDAAGEIAATDWAAAREPFADRIEGILRAHVRNWDAIRLARAALSPADLEALNPNLVGGDPYGGACTIDQFFLFRPFPDSQGAKTAVKGLLHIGASTHPGPGLGGGSGFNAAKALGA